MRLMQRCAAKMAATKKTMTEAQFQALVRKIKRLQEESESQSVDTALETYWSFGDLIASQRVSEELGYHNSVLRDLARETGVSLRALQQSVAFRGAYDEAPVGQELTWSHYRSLVRLSTAKQRDFYAERARSEGWTSKELQRAISSDLYSGGKLEKPRLARPTDPSFLYGCGQVRVIDGDTIEVLIDLGFHSFSEQRLRLAQVDAPDVDTKEGRAARNFLIDTMGRAQTTVLKTLSTDVHGRYVAHVFCMESSVSIDECFEQGTHINDLLVAKKHAHVVG